jgi:hypothetical protein
MKTAAIALSLLALLGSAVAEVNCQDPNYEPSQNQIEVGPWTVKSISGYVEDSLKSRISGTACVRLFTNREKKFVSGTATNEKGEFHLTAPPVGDYRLVVTCDGLCGASFGIKVSQTGSGKKIVVHMIPGGIDSCSWSSLK